MEDEEDLELLRLAALKSLNNKKEAEPAHILAPLTTHLINGNANHIQPVGESARQLVNDYYSAVAAATPAASERLLLNAGHRSLGPYLHSNFEKIDLNDPYAPKTTNLLLTGNVFNDYQSPFISKPSPNVQLSPRSAAFVLQNNDILMRRKGGRTPDSTARSHSPTAYRKSPGRWSPTPPPLAKSRSPKRSPSYVYRRSISRSPVNRLPRSPINRRTPPHMRNRSISRSPQRRRHSPFPIHVRRSKSRSPLPRNMANINHRTQQRSRSPVPHSSSRRANSPPNRNAARARRANSPMPAPVNRNNGNHNRRSVSPRGNDDTGNYRAPVRRRTRSPPNNNNNNHKNDVRRRSSSRSPARKYQRNVGARRRRSPPQPRKFTQRNSNNTSRNNGPPARTRTNNNLQRSVSPSNNSHRRSKSRTPPSAQHKVKSENKADAKDATMPERAKATRKEEHQSDAKCAPVNEANKTETKTEEQIEDELLATTNDENSDSDSDNDDDGIDLFASEESESENEGRFKLSSRQTEKPPPAVTTVPFSKLGSIAKTDLCELNELRTDKTSSASRKNGRDERERDRDRDRTGTRNAYRREPNGRYGGRKQGADTKNRDRDINRTWKSSKTVSKRKDVDADAATEKERKPIMFKSTFQAIDTETRTKTPDAGKSHKLIIYKMNNRHYYQFHFLSFTRLDKSSDSKNKSVSEKRILRRPTSKQTEKGIFN